MEPTTSPTSSSLRRLLFLAIFGLASLVLFWTPLGQWFSLSLDDPRYSHLILIPLISAVVLFLLRRKIFPRTAFSLRLGLPLLAAALSLYGTLASRHLSLPDGYALSARMFALVLLWIAVFALCFGAQASRVSLFPLLFLFLIVPMPSGPMDKIIAFLQQGSADCTFALFRLLGVPMFRDGVQFQLPGVSIEIAAECSSIHSCWALFITGLLVSHMFLRLFWAKFCLSVLTPPIAVFTNAIRIVTIWTLGTNVDTGFFYGRLHRDGGILFSLISLSILVGFLSILRRMERASHPSVTPAGSADGLAVGDLRG